MKTKKTAEVLEMMDNLIGSFTTVGRFDQFVNRKQFRVEAVGGGKSRVWTFADALRLCVFLKLVDEVGIAPEQAGFLTSLKYIAPQEKPSFFVAYRSQTDDPIFSGAWNHDIVAASQLSTFLQSGCRKPMVASNDLRPEWEYGPASSAVIFNLDELADRLQTAWNEGE